jgi:hypothetical protein
MYNVYDFRLDGCTILQKGTIASWSSRAIVVYVTVFNVHTKENDTIPKLCKLQWHFTQKIGRTVSPRNIICFYRTWHTQGKTDYCACLIKIIAKRTVITGERRNADPVITIIYIREPKLTSVMRWFSAFWNLLGLIFIERSHQAMDQCFTQL